MARIKVCGITNKKDALKAVRLGAWALGFIFYKKSSRYIAPEIAKKIITVLPKKIISVGVFVNANDKEIRQVVEMCGLKAIQFHGNETPKFCLQFKGMKTIKALRVKTKSDIKKASLYKTDFLLFDTYKKGSFGGTGKSFDWDFLGTQRNILKRSILSGGLNPENITEAVSLVKAYAFDVSSGVEKRPGKKCQRLLKKFFGQANLRGGS
ncbi:MAG: phosphoribosylanthranilate isomerase [Candidatus Omnitrophota bacterium]